VSSRVISLVHEDVSGVGMRYDEHGVVVFSGESLAVTSMVNDGGGS
jgi:hypothetical protein